jgi:tetratricopeptide (TPR) repeat protein
MKVSHCTTKSVHSIRRLTRWAAACILVCGLGAALSVVAQAQTAMIRGTVTVKESAEASPAPREGVQILILRQDIKQRVQTKTDKKGAYLYTLPAFGTYVVVAHGAGLKANVSPSIRLGGGEPTQQDFELVPGDGSLPSDEQILAMGSAAPAAGGGQPTKEQLAEYERQKAEYDKAVAANAKAKEDFEGLKKHFLAGNDFFGKKDYKAAVAEYKQAAAIDQTQIAVYANMAKAQLNIAVDAYNAKQRDEAKAAFQDSAKNGMKALELDNAGPADKRDATIKEKLAEALGFLGQLYGDAESAGKAADYYKEIADSKSDAKEKMKNMSRAADAYRLGNILDKAEATYRAILEKDPNNCDAMYGLALTLVVLDPEFKDTAKGQEAYSLLEKVGEKSADAKQKQAAMETAQYIEMTLKDLVKQGGGKKKKKG